MRAKPYHGHLVPPCAKHQRRWLAVFQSFAMTYATLKDRRSLKGCLKAQLGRLARPGGHSKTTASTPRHADTKKVTPLLSHAHITTYCVHTSTKPADVGIATPALKRFFSDEVIIVSSAGASLRLLPQHQRLLHCCCSSVPAEVVHEPACHVCELVHCSTGNLLHLLHVLLRLHTCTKSNSNSHVRPAMRCTGWNMKLVSNQQRSRHWFGRNSSPLTSG
jgi:hypothetical protein